MPKTTDLDLILAKAQVGLAYTLLLGFFAMLFALIFFRASMDDKTLTLFTSIVTVLPTILALALQYFFSRPRHTKANDPESTDDTADTPTGVTNVPTTINAQTVHHTVTTSPPITNVP